MISYRLAVAGTSLAIGLGLTGCTSKVAPPSGPPPAGPPSPVKIFDAHDSPVTVEGGSIHAQGNNVPVRVDDTHYTMTTTNFDQLYINGFVNWTTTVPPNPITGWTTITIDTDQIQGAVTISKDPTTCSAANCIIHLKTDSNSRWHKNGRGQLRYHNKSNACDGPDPNGKGENSDCDFFAHINVTYITNTATTPPTTTTVKGDCNDVEYGPGYCMIGIGKP